MQISGESKDQVVVIGEEVDSISLTRSLRKKVGSARLVSMGEVKEIVKVEEAQKKEDNVQASSNYQSILSHYNMTIYMQPWVYYKVVHAKSPDFCCIVGLSRLIKV